jgi:hypothetical protein
MAAANLLVSAKQQPSVSLGHKSLLSTIQLRPVGKEYKEFFNRDLLLKNNPVL